MEQPVLPLDHVIVWDSDVFWSQLIATILASLHIPNVTIVSGFEDADLELLNTPCDCLITDWRSGSEGCLDHVRNLRQTVAHINRAKPIILCTARTTRAEVIEARDAGASEVLTRPVNAANIVTKLRAVSGSSRTFIDADNFIGPDRRRRRKIYDGTERRQRSSRDAQKTADSFMHSQGRL